MSALSRAYRACLLGLGLCGGPAYAQNRSAPAHRARRPPVVSPGRVNFDRNCLEPGAPPQAPVEVPREAPLPRRRKDALWRQGLRQGDSSHGQHGLQHRGAQENHGALRRPHRGQQRARGSPRCPDPLLHRPRLHQFRRRDSRPKGCRWGHPNGDRRGPSDRHRGHREQVSEFRLYQGPAQARRRATAQCQGSARADPDNARVARDRNHEFATADRATGRERPTLPPVSRRARESSSFRLSTTGCHRPWAMSGCCRRSMSTT